MPSRPPVLVLSLRPLPRVNSIGLCCIVHHAQTPRACSYVTPDGIHIQIDAPVVPGRDSSNMWHTPFTDTCLRAFPSQSTYSSFFSYTTEDSRPVGNVNSSLPPGLRNCVILSVSPRRTTVTVRDILHLHHPVAHKDPFSFMP